MGNTASIVSISSLDRTRAETAAWSRFSAPRDGTEFCSGWLAILCTQIDGVTGAMVLLGSAADGDFAPAAMWPDSSHDLQYLAPAAERTLNERRGLVIAAGGASRVTPDQAALVGYPIEVAGELHGAVVLDIAPSPDRDLQRALRLLHWASAWLVDRFRQRTMEQRDAAHARSAAVMDLVATAFGERQLSAAASAVSNELAGLLHCDRVSIGLESQKWMTILALSHTAVFNDKMALVRRIAEAMDEMLDLGAAVVHPAQSGGTHAAVAHAVLAREFGDVAICTVPLLDDGQTIGAITLERSAGEAFDADTIELCQIAGTLLGPVLGLKRDAERGVWRRARERAQGGAQALFGPRHPGVKLIAGLAVVLVLVFSFVPTTYRVAAKATIEGAVQRAAVAPFDGHIAESAARAGDIVQAGQLLARLDDRDLRLERAKLVSEREQAERKYRQALASQDRSSMVIGAAQVSQLEAQIALAEDKLGRVNLTAPFSGIVVSGDLSQLLGAPVETGKLLFQIAPLDDYRIVLQVDERDISDVSLGQQGELALSGLPFQALPFTVRQITPVTTVQDGRNFFRVEGALTTAPARLRPGMEGIGKVTVGDRNLLWVWTHSMVEWLGNWAWKELP